MRNLLIFAAVVHVLTACVSDGISPSPVIVDFRVAAAPAGGNAQASGTARGESRQIVISGIVIADCSVSVRAGAQQYGRDKLVLNLLSEPGGGTCDTAGRDVAYEYESVLKGLKPGVYTVEILQDHRSFPAPTQVVTVR